MTVLIGSIDVDFHSVVHMVHNTASQLPEMRLNILWALTLFLDIFLPFGRVLLLFQVCWNSFFFFLTALPSQCTCILLFPLLPCLRVGFDFFNAWLLSPHGNCKLQENASTELNLDASYISVLAFHASGQGSEWESESRSRSETAAKLWLFCCPWAMSFLLESLFQQSGKQDLAQDWLWWWNQTFFWAYQCIACCGCRVKHEEKSKEQVDQKAKNVGCGA